MCQMGMDNQKSYFSEVKCTFLEEGLMQESYMKND